jgi:hypothetical protein
MIERPRDGQQTAVVADSLGFNISPRGVMETRASEQNPAPGRSIARVRTASPGGAIPIERPAAKTPGEAGIAQSTTFAEIPASPMAMK